MFRVLLLGIMLLGGPFSAWADNMLDLIPAAALSDRQPLEETPDAGDSRTSIEFNYSSYAWREGESLAVPQSNLSTPAWGATTGLNLLGNTNWNDSALHWNAHLQIQGQDDDDVTLSEDAELFIKEIYLSHGEEPVIFDLGRINQRYGVASGFNPTDFYRKKASVGNSNIDPGRQREDRFGTLAFRLTSFWPAVTSSLMFSPDLNLEDDNSLAADKDVIGLKLNRTNDTTRLTFRTSWQRASGLLAEVLFHLDESAPSAGFNLSGSIGDGWLWHAETLFAKRQTLLAEGQSGLVSDDSEQWRLQSSVGGTYTSGNNISSTLEVHFNQAGLSENDWERWFALSRDDALRTTSAAALWNVRRLAAERQEPLSRWQLFLRISWADVLLDDLTLNALAMINPYDGSLMGQVESLYPFNDTIVATARIMSNIGDSESEHGSKPNQWTALCKLEYFF